MLGVTGPANLCEEAVRLAQLALAVLLLTALAGQLGELHVAPGLERLRARLARQLEGACERCLDVLALAGAGRAE